MDRLPTPSPPKASHTTCKKRYVSDLPREAKHASREATAPESRAPPHYAPPSGARRCRANCAVDGCCASCRCSGQPDGIRELQYQFKSSQNGSLMSDIPNLSTLVQGVSLFQFLRTVDDGQGAVPLGFSPPCDPLLRRSAAGVEVPAMATGRSGYLASGPPHEETRNPSLVFRHVTVQHFQSCNQEGL